MAEILAALIEALKSPDTILTLGWLLAIGEGIFIAKRLNTESEVVKELRDELKQLQATHTAALIAEKENRIADLRELVETYKATLERISRSISKLGGGK